MLISILFGLFAYGHIIGTLEGADIVPEKRLSPYNIYAILQCVVFYLGIIFLIVYVGLTL